ncbi:MAG: TIGR03905 family TSCPD domain-containing protein [Bacilli bacterium]|nr:TIGR03905 family TSCPD domain-containing protein [Bacilli bacterium]
MERIIIIKPEGVCSREMKVIVNDGVVSSMEVIGGCQGNLQGISKLVVGMKVEDVVTRLEGIKCRGSRSGQSSCPNELAKGLKKNI